MRKQHWARRDPIKNYFPLPNDIFSLGLSSTAIAIYGYLLFREDRKTYERLASYRMPAVSHPAHPDVHQSIYRAAAPTAGSGHRPAESTGQTVAAVCGTGAAPGGRTTHHALGDVRRTWSV